jgi:glycosyltransferase involved in cell wall biosynthesis
MVREALVGARERDWTVTAVFPEQARDHDWARALAEEAEVKFLPASRAAVAELVAADETAILHAHFNSYDLVAALAARGRPGVRVVWHAHGIVPHAPVARLRSFAKYTAGRRLVDAIVCVGQHLEQGIVRSGASRRQTVYLPNGIETDRFRPATAQARQAARESLGLADGRPVVLHYGWSWQLKGGDVLCAAAAELRRRGVEVTALTVGAGPEAAADARRLGIEDELVSLPQTQAVDELLAASDVLALPSRDEGGNPPFAVLECLASGVPVVAGDIPGQTFGRGLAAYRAVPLEAGAFADAIEAQLGTSAEARAAARAHIEAERSLAVWGDRLQALYDEILAGRPPDSGSGDAVAE